MCVLMGCVLLLFCWHRLAIGDLPLEARLSALPPSFASLVAILPDYISPMDDITFGLNMDEEAAAKIRELQAEKERAEAAEDYRRCKEIKKEVAYLQEVGQVGSLPNGVCQMEGAGSGVVRRSALLVLASLS